MRHLLGKTHLRRREFEAVVGLRHLIGHLQGEIARRREVLDDDGLDVDLRACRLIHEQQGRAGEEQRE